MRHVGAKMQSSAMDCEHALWPRARDLFAPKQSRHSVTCVASAGIAQGAMPTASGPTADVGRSRDAAQLEDWTISVTHDRITHTTSLCL